MRSCINRDAWQMCKCALKTAWWCGHTALIKLWQPTDIRSNVPNPILSPRAQLPCQIKEELNKAEDRCLHFIYVEEESEWYLKGLGGGGSLVGEVGQLRSEWGWEWDSQVNASDDRGIRECPVSTNVQVKNASLVPNQNKAIYVFQVSLC